MKLLDNLKKIFYVSARVGAPIAKMGISGKLRLIGSNYNKDGVLEQVFDKEIHNLITYAGFDLMFDVLGLNAQPSDITHMAIGSGAVVEVGSVVTKDVPEGTTVIGVPAREFRSRN